MSETSLWDRFVKQIYGDCARGGSPVSPVNRSLSISLSALPRAENVIPAGKKPMASQLGSVTDRQKGPDVLVGDP